MLVPTLLPVLFATRSITRSHDPITDEDVEEGERLIRNMLPHVTDCDGLVLAIEVLPEDRRRAIFAARDRALGNPVTMMDWGERRGRSPLPPD
jgi:hypothetical protein